MVQENSTYNSNSMYPSVNDIHRSDGPSKTFGRTVKEVGYVGFANVPNQIYRRAVKAGFDCTIMVVGQSGIGKSTFINSLLLSTIYGTDGQPRLTKPTTQITEKTVKVTERGVKVNLTLIDTPGFGDCLDNTDCWKPISEYIESKYAMHLKEEQKVNRKLPIIDKRVHVCLYFISPTGHGLKQIDVDVLKNLHDRVNIIPIIAKADTYTQNELANFKAVIREELAKNGIKTYQFKQQSEDDALPDELANRIAHLNVGSNEVKKLQDRWPFAVVGSNAVIEKPLDNGMKKKVRARQYPWGVVEVENLEHNDFCAVRDIIIRTCFMDLVFITNYIHYENYRYQELHAKAGFNGEALRKVMTSSPEGNNRPKSGFALEQMAKQQEDELKQYVIKNEKILNDKVAEKRRDHDARETEALQLEQRLRDKLKAKTAERDAVAKRVEQLRTENPGITGGDSKSSIHRLQQMLKPINHNH